MREADSRSGKGEQKLGYLVEEAGEVLAAAGKTLRWGPESINPELPCQAEKNGDWVLRELDDLDRAIRLVRDDLRLEMKSIDGEDRADPLPARIAALECLARDMLGWITAVAGLAANHPLDATFRTRARLFAEYDAAR